MPWAQVGEMAGRCLVLPDARDDEAETTASAKDLRGDGLQRPAASSGCLSDALNPIRSAGMRRPGSARPCTDTFGDGVARRMRARTRPAAC
mmetsp:Transcript_115946/g.374212  ORF Transcript_115946/g.374212 Transcript_115946/m.374212 type:complete len:91 (+) Transcript_115946:210-482(+)